MSGKIYQGEHLTIPFPQDGTLKGLEIQGKTVQESVDESYLSAEGKHIIIDSEIATNTLLPLVDGENKIQLSDFENGGIATADGKNMDTANAKNSRLRTKDHIEVEENTVYTLDFKNEKEAYIWLYYYDADKIYIGESGLNKTDVAPYTFQTYKGAKYIRVALTYYFNRSSTADTAYAISINDFSDMSLIQGPNPNYENYKVEENNLSITVAGKSIQEQKEVNYPEYVMTLNEETGEYNLKGVATQQQEEVNYPEITMTLDETTGHYYLNGETIQTVGTGKNLFNYRDTKETSSATLKPGGWINLTLDNTQGTSVKYANYFTNINSLLKENTQYAIFLEVKEITRLLSSSSSYINIIGSENTTQFKNTFRTNCANVSVGTTKITSTTKESFDSCTMGTRNFLSVAAGDKVSITFRLSILEDTTTTVDTFKYEQYGIAPSPDCPSELINTYEAGTYQTIINSQKYVITLTDDLRSITERNGTTRDKLWLNIKNLKSWVDKKVHVKTFTQGSDFFEWTAGSNPEYQFAYTWGNSAISLLGISNYFPTIVASQFGIDYGIYPSRSYTLRISYPPKTFDEFKAWVEEKVAEGNPFTVYYDIQDEPENLITQDCYKWNRPSSNNKIDINVIEGKIKAFKLGRNFLPVEETVTFSGYRTYNVRIPAGTYILSTLTEAHEGANNSVIKFENNGSTTSISNNMNKTITLTKDENLIRLYSNGYSANNSNGVNATIGQLMLSINGGEYENYKETIEVIDLGDNFLAKVSDEIIDSINIDIQKRVKLTKNLKKVTLDETAQVYIEADERLTEVNRFRIEGVLNQATETSITGICSHSVHARDYIANYEHFYYTLSGHIYLFISKEIASTGEELKIWLGENKPVFYYELATPEEIDLTEKSYEWNIPSPSNRIEVKNIEVQNRKNLFDQENILRIANFTIGDTYWKYYELPDEFKQKITVSMVKKSTTPGLVMALVTQTSVVPTAEERFLVGGSTPITRTYDFTNAEHVYFGVGNANKYNQKDLKKIRDAYDIQIEPGEVATEYEEFIRYNDRINIKAIGKNILPRNFGQDLLNRLGISSTNTTNCITEIDGNTYFKYDASLGYQTGENYFIKDVFKEKTQYTFKAAFMKSNSETSGALNLVVRYTDGTNTSYNAGTWTNMTERDYAITTAAGKTVKEIGINYNSGQTFINLDKYILCKATLDEIECEPYQEQKVDFPLIEGQEISEGSYLSDIGIYNNVYRITFTGNEAFVWGGNTGFDRIYYYPQQGRYDFVENKGYCNYFKLANFSGRNDLNNNFCFFIGKANEGGNFTLQFRYDGIGSLANFKQWLKDRYNEGNPVVVEIYTTTTNTILYTPEQQKAWNKLKNFKLYKTGTNLISSENLSVKYNHTYASPSPDMGNLFDRHKIVHIDGFVDSVTGAFIKPNNMQKSFYMPVEPNTTYRIGNFDRSSNIGLYSAVPKIGSFAIHYRVISAGAEQIITTNDQEKFLVCLYSGGSTATYGYSNVTIRKETIKDIKDNLEIKTTNSDQENFRESTTIFPLGNTKLRSLPNGTMDTIEKVNDVWSIVQRIGEVIFDGSEGWYISGRQHSETMSLHTDAKLSDMNKDYTTNERVFLCDRFVSREPELYYRTLDEEFCCQNINSGFCLIVFRIKRDKLETQDVAGFAKWLKENPVTVRYELQNEKIIPLSMEQQTVLNSIPIYGPTTVLTTTNDLNPVLVVNTGDFTPLPTPEMEKILAEEPNLGTRVNLEIWSHDDEFIDTLYNTDYEFEGQCIDPKMTLNANGSKTLTLSLPLYVIDKKTREYVENPRWAFITQQYKIRVQQDDRINEFVLKDYTESHDQNDQLMININAQSLEEFELSQIGYNITFNENSLYRYNLNEDPNDPDTVPIGTYEPDIHFWNEKLLENSDWEYRVESYYPVDKEMPADNRQITDLNLNYKNGKEQFYEEDRIIDYTDENKPIYAEEYEVKKRVVKAEKSNIFNIVQDICEAFECWPTFEIQYLDGKIIKKTIVYKNDVPQDAMFSVNYQTNLNSIERIVDSSQVVTKMYVTPIQNENVDNGIISISTNPKNYMKENYLLDLSWYMGEPRVETDLRNKRLINPKIGMHFASTEYSEPVIKEPIDTVKTADTVETYKKNIRARNTYIENMSLQLARDQEKLINLKTEREYVQGQKDAAQETVNTLIDEIALIGNTELRKEDKACYLYKQNNIFIIRFSEIGIKAVPKAETFNMPINLLTPDGRLYYDKDNVPAGLGEGEWEDIKKLQIVPYKIDPIIGTILECQVTNAIIGTSTDGDYASFKCSFDYDPYDYYKKLISYWNAKIIAATNRLNELGKSRENGGNEGLIYDLETQVIVEKQKIFQAQQEKAQVIKEFENKFNPYIREGYWENTDFGIYMNNPIEKTHIPSEHKILKYNQDGTDTTEETEKYEWSKDYVNFRIPNILINNAQGGNTYLYNIIDIEEIEVMNDDPLNENSSFRAYVKGTDYILEYGYSSLTPGVSENDRGIYIRFYEPEVDTSNTNIPRFSAGSQVYLRVKARGDNQYIWSGYSKAEYQEEQGETKRKWFCPLEQRISIDDTDIVLSSIIVKANTSKVNYDTNNNLSIDTTQYELKYGKDYYTSKETENGRVISRITFYQTTNVPLMDFNYANYTIQYNQDITAKYYYNDALKVMKESSIPQTTYSINVVDISEAQNFLNNLKWYKPQVGTRVPIYDEELRFEGLVGFINSVTFDLLNPQNTQLSITNFKDKFVDLFQKITASTIALQSKEYEYDRSTQIVTIEGGINKEVLKDTFQRPDSNFSVTPNSNIVWDYNGITSTSDKLNENGVYAQVRVTPNGIFTSNQQDEFGNYIWTTAITPQGINASQLTIGKLDTRQIQIFNSSEPRFLWNENGLYAYGQNNGKTDYETYVLYNENGIKFRQLMKSTNKVILPNIVKTPTFSDLTNWTWNSTDGTVFNSAVATEIETTTASEVKVYKATVSSNKVTNNLTLMLNSTIKDLVKTHKYYFRVYVKVNNIPELNNIDINGGFNQFFKNIQYSQNNEYVRIEGFVTGVTNENKFAVNVTLPISVSDWSISVKKPMILDVTEIFGETIPSSQWFSDLEDIVNQREWTTEMDVYGDALRLDWGGLRIGAQDNSLQLTSQDGLVIYHPVTTETDNERRMRLQLGQWREPQKDENGNIVTNGTEILYEDLYGLRALDLNGNMIFKVTQKGVEFDFTNDLESTIEKYSAEAALGAISSTNTSNLLKNSCGYVYQEETDATGSPTGVYKFFDWTVENTECIFPINERFVEIDDENNEIPIVTGTVSKHAFKMTGKTTVGGMPLIKQTISVAATPGVVQPYTLKFLMKGTPNLENDTIKNGIRLKISEAGNQEDIDVNVPYLLDKGWQVVKHTIYTEMSEISIEIENISTITIGADGELENGVIYLSDLMFTSGKDTPAWTVSPGEVYNNYVTIGSEGVVVTSNRDSTGSIVRTVMDSHSFRVESINLNKEISTNILVTEDNTTLGPTHIRGKLDVGNLVRLRFTEVIDGDDSGVDVTLIGVKRED